MREIKFRAYDKRQDMMIPSDQMMRLELNKSGIEWVDCWVITPDNEGDPEQGLHQINKEDLELMQYTGCKDKNKKEIYEGDIIKLPLDSLNPEEVKTVEFNEQGFWSYFTAYEYGEVLGNKYENPELLKLLK